jgi:hypothetical protein
MNQSLKPPRRTQRNTSSPIPGTLTSPWPCLPSTSRISLQIPVHSPVGSWYVQDKRLASWAAVPVFFLGRSVSCVSAPSPAANTEKALFEVVSRMRKPVMALPAGVLAGHLAGCFDSHQTHASGRIPKMAESLIQHIMINGFLLYRCEYMCPK